MREKIDFLYEGRMKSLLLYPTLRILPTGTQMRGIIIRTQKMERNEERSKEKMSMSYAFLLKSANCTRFCIYLVVYLCFNDTVS